MSSDTQNIAQKCVDKLWEGDTASQHLNMKILSVEAGIVAMQMRIEDTMLNGHKTCHGGYIFSLADSCFAFACNSRNDKMVAQQCSINFCQPAMEGDLLTASSKEAQRKGRSAIYDIEVVNEAGEIIAIFRGLARQIKGQHLEETSP